MAHASRGKKPVMEQAAIRLFAEKGVIQTTVKDIAAAAGVTEGALYRHYPGKEEMAWALFIRELTAFTAGLRDCLTLPGCSGRERLARAVGYTLDYYRDHPGELAFVLLTRHGFAAERYVPAHKNPVELLAAMLKEAMRNGEIPPQPPRLLAAMVMGVVLHPMELLRYKNAVPELTLAPQARGRITSACLALLGGEPAEDRTTSALPEDSPEDSPERQPDRQPDRREPGHDREQAEGRTEADQENHHEAQ